MSIVETPAPDVASVRWLGYGLTAIGTVAPIVLLFSPVGLATDALVLAAVILPLILLACIAYAPGAFEVNSQRYRTRMINLVLILPAATLVIITLNTPLVRPEIGWLFAGAGAALAVLVGIWSPGRASLTSPQAMLLILGLYGACYGWAAPTLVDLRFDHSTGQVFQAPVVGRGISYGRHGTANHYLRLGPWGPMTATATVTVNADTYSVTKEGDIICVTLHPGALAMPWYRAAVC